MFFFPHGTGCLDPWDLINTTAKCVISLKSRIGSWLTCNMQIFFFCRQSAGTIFLTEGSTHSSIDHFKWSNYPTNSQPLLFLDFNICFLLVILITEKCCRYRHSITNPIFQQLHYLINYQCNVQTFLFLWIFIF